MNAARGQPTATKSGRWWFVVRKYPPAIGGMELLSFNVTSRLAERRPVTVLPMRAPSWMLPVFMLTSSLRIAVACAKGDVALLHVGDPVLAPIAWVARLFGIPCSITLHGLDIVHDKGLYPLWRRAFLRGFRAYVCISEATRLAAERLHIPAQRMHVIGIGIDAVDEAGVQPARDMNAVLFVGRLVRRKGLAWFVTDVLPALASRHRDVRLVVLGDGPERAPVANAAKSRGVAERIEWLGAAGDDEKQRWFAKAAVCVMPNVAVAGDMEGFGIVALEAAAAGCPVVASDLEGLRDAVTDGESGRLVRSGDAGAWLAALDERIGDPRSNAALGERARSHVQRARGWGPIIDAYENVLSRMLGADHPARASR
jgi:phosphatidylinositol alpha-1,6-mannosyltransferase